MEFDGALLAGGASRRMGTHKGDLTIDGQSFAQRIADQLQDFRYRFLSVGGDCPPPPPGFLVVRDIHPGRGPIGGLHALLRACRSDGVLVVACDMPRYQKELGEYLLDRMSPGVDAVVPVARDGRIHPLCAVYRKEAADLLEQQITAGDLRLMRALDRMAVERVPLAGTPFPDSMLANINTPQAYAALLEETRQEGT